MSPNTPRQPRDFLAYWKPNTAAANLAHGGRLQHAASNQYGKVYPGDSVWIVTTRDGELRLLGRIIVNQITDGDTAAKRLGKANLWAADYHIISDDAEATPIRDVDIAEIASQLRFVSRMGNDRLDVSNSKIRSQQLQRMRELTPESAQSLGNALGLDKKSSRSRVAPENKPEISVDHEDAHAAEPKPKRPHAAAPKQSKRPDVAVKPTPPRTVHDRTAVFAALKRLQAAGRKSGDLIKGEYRSLDRSEIELNGLCYVLSECMYHLFPGTFKPHRISWDGVSTHWFLRSADGAVLDGIAENGEMCFRPSAYEGARRVGFLSKQPSKRARILLKRAGLSLPE
jgi:hypothetical protein